MLWCSCPGATALMFLANCSDWPASIPVLGRLGDVLEEGSFVATDIGQFNNCSWMGLGVEIDEAALLTTDLALLPDAESSG